MRYTKIWRLNKKQLRDPQDDNAADSDHYIDIPADRKVLRIVLSQAVKKFSFLHRLHIFLLYSHQFVLYCQIEPGISFALFQTLCR